MNKKAESDIGIGVIITVAIALIVGAVLFLAVAQEVGQVTTTVTIANESFTTGANGSITALPGQQNTTAIVVWMENGTSDILTGNHTLRGGQILNGALTNTYEVRDGQFASMVVNISYTYEPDGFIDGAAGSIADLIAIFFAIAIAVVALVPTMRSKILDAI